MRPWKALLKERIANSGEPIISPINEELYQVFRCSCSLQVPLA